MTAIEAEALRVSSLMSSRLCHDLAGVVGAISAGLEMSEDEDPEMASHAKQVVTESTDKALAIVKLARLAYGSSGGFEGDLDMNEAREAAKGFFAHAEAELVWDLEEYAVPKWQGRAMLNVLIVMERAVPRSPSTVRLSRVNGHLTASATGKKVKAKDPLLGAFSGQSDDLEPKEMPAYLAYLLAQSGGARFDTHFVLDEELTVTLVAD
ncbi:hypothetical protein PB2503_09339 [Parvularcula bermudensis HTCC2503]|uniref:Histidine phosphotransferase ChpT C-terminal domain-containing protein n=1 Tax=Parvularcula bermudensis (strain ATCC BAA-594 / HTCC2503 / KCTC 12087) TaxID=314260 RepID=E0TD98_PARBH|nr:histidine phosphotransferase family protein [Parvularcula bermudensis]ADM09921.1 hypothetical protein PB2503_09339 [Parvularcula bermudensis HTCC2503]